MLANHILFISILFSSNLFLAKTLLKSPRDFKLGVNYESYMFATEWSASACIFENCFVYPKPQILNIHGLWPSGGADDPFECKEFRFNENNINPSIQKLVYDHWSGLYKKNWDFIRYELKKHGSCWNPDLGDKSKIDTRIVDLFSKIDPKNEFSFYDVYMQIAVYLSEKINPYSVLEKAGISPSDTVFHTVNDFVSAINTHFGLSNALIPICKKDKTQGYVYIVEMRFCLDLNYNIIDCDPIVVRRNIAQCGKEGLGYPTEPSRSYSTVVFFN